MPAKGVRAGGESRLSLEGLTGVRFRKKTISSIHAHGERKRSRVVTYEDGSTEVVSIRVLLNALIQSKGA